jgi:hypothetical protein
MLIIQKTRNSVYCLAELDRAVSKLHYATFQLVPYHTHSQTFIPVMHILDQDNLTRVVQEEAANVSEALDNEEDVLTKDGQDF